MSLAKPSRIISKLTPDEYDEDGQDFLITFPNGEMLAETYRWNALHAGVGDETDMYDVWCELKDIIKDPSQQYYLLRTFAQCMESNPYTREVAVEALDVIAPYPSVRSDKTDQVLELVNQMHNLIENRISDREQYDVISDKLFKYIDDNNDDNAVIILGSYGLAIYGYDTLETVGALLTHARSQSEPSEKRVIDSMFSSINNGEMFIDMPPMSLLYDTGHHSHLLSDLNSLSDSDDESNHQLNIDGLVEINNKTISDENYTILDCICIATLCNIALEQDDNSDIVNLRERIAKYGLGKAVSMLYDRDARVLSNLANLD